MKTLPSWLIDHTVNFDADSIHHAHIISGRDGVGKELLASYLAKLILCHGKKKEPCGNCQSCNLTDGINHPDLSKLEVLPDKKLIGISQILDLRRKLYESSFLGKNKVAIIPDLEKISLDGLNAILKILEEPPENTYFLLTTSFLNQIPLTIQSRCFDIKIGTPDESVTLEWLKDYPKQDSLKALSLTNNRPLLAKEFLEKKILHKRQEFIDEISLIIKQGGNLISTSEKWIEADESINIKLEWMSKLLCDSITFHADSSIMTLTEDTDKISKYLSTTADINNLHNLLSKTNKIWNLFSKDTNLRKDYQLSSLFVDWEKDLGISKKL